MKTKAKKRTRTTQSLFSAHVQIVGAIMGELDDVRIASARGNPTSHAIFPFAETKGFPPGFAQLFQRLARASRVIKTYRFTRRPRLLACAQNHVEDVLGSGFQLGRPIPSCPTPAGWEPPEPGHPCTSFPLSLSNRRANSPDALPIHCAGRELTLRYFVSVHLDEAATPVGP